MKPRLIFCNACLAGVLMQPALARAAATCKASDRPFVELTVDVEPPDQVIANTLARQLAAELDARGIDLCEGSAAPRKPVGRVYLRVERTPGGPTNATIRIGDEVTDKRVERTMDLTQVPRDSRPLSVAAAADELLRASWAELLIADAPTPVTPPPAVVVVAVRATVKPGALLPRRFESGLFASGSAFPRRRGIGCGLVVGLAFSNDVAALLRTSIEQGLDTASTHGSVRTDTTSFGVGLEYALTSGPLGVHVSADTRLLQVRYSATATAGNRENDSTDWAWLSGWGPRFCYDVGAARVHLGATALVGIRPSRATDAGHEVTSIGRFGGEATLGLSLRL